MAENNNEEILLLKKEVNYAVKLLTNGQINEALKIVEALIKKSPNAPLLYNIRGVCYQTIRELGNAIDDFSQATILKSDYAEAYCNLGVTYQEKGDLENAVKAYKNAIVNYNNYPTAHNNLGKIFLASGEIDSSIEHLERAITLKPDFADAHNNLGSAFLRINKLNDAIKSYKKAITLKPDFAVANNNLGIAYLRTGDPMLASKFFENAITITPGYATAHHNLSGVKVYKEKDKQLNLIESLLIENNLSQKERIYLNFALAKAYEDLGNHKKLFKHLNEGNRIRKKEMSNSIADSEEHNELIKLFFNSNNIILTYRDLLPIRPIFIVGMPRSGTSLVEQIISSHHEVYGAGEVNNFHNIIMPIIEKHAVNENYNLNNDEFALIRKQYSNSLVRFYANEKVITDKWTLNFKTIGFILSAFPESKIVHLKRDARATCWSIYKHYFSDEGNRWAYDYQDLARFYKSYVGLMDYWHNLFPGKIYDISYEDLTSNQEKETRNLLKYCDLDWDENCLNFYTNTRAVKTASAVQVRNKMYQGSSDVWRQYSEHLKPLLDALK
ncbi:tetratricopeptide repeat protein [Candidatus Pseudothioglobus singularis]|nr:tetratricopeptide repeat protein [Candidatus Pseudothioglobus singularis]